MHNQKIVIDNFGPIKHAEIEITPLLILIGEQATGKSTIAKLIYFFKSLSDDFLNECFYSSDSDVDFVDELMVVANNKFFDYFGSPYQWDVFNIQFYYNNKKNIAISLDKNKSCEVRVSLDFFNQDDCEKLEGYKNELTRIRKEINQAEFNGNGGKILEHKQKDYLNLISEKINEIFCNYHYDISFIPAGRNATVGYSAFFEGMLTSNLQQAIKKQNERSFEAKEQTLDEILLLDFLRDVSAMRNFMIKFGGFDGVIRNNSGEKKNKLIEALTLIDKVIRGRYIPDNDERIIFDGDKSVFLKNASSGQQESIRILQYAFFGILSSETVFYVIEEPEAHIFPEAQMYMLQLLAIVLNNFDNNNIIITTHSPYVLSVINNLMYAYRVGQIESDKVNGIVGKESWIAPEKVNAYMLSSANGTERIIDDELCMIKAEKIDGVSRKLNDDFDKLLEIEYEHGKESE